MLCKVSVIHLSKCPEQLLRTEGHFTSSHCYSRTVQALCRENVILSTGILQRLHIISVSCMGNSTTEPAKHH